MFNFGNANEEQKKAISTTEGPLLIIAGPGTGKTYTLVQRILYLIVEKKIKLEQIFISTFTEKAAKELVTRITDELSKHNIQVNLQDMYVGTFHSICLRLLKEYLEYTTIRKNYRLLDSFDQIYTIFQNIYRFRNIENYNVLFEGSINGTWMQANILAEYINSISEELVPTEKLLEDSEEKIRVLAEVVNVYREILKEQNLLDFSSIQTECYKLLSNNPNVLKDVRAKIKYIMVDEYQDTNYIQEQLVFLLSNDNKNICVVGDDDQGLYRFRGATIRNILEFPQKFKNIKCGIVHLNTNYRSNSDIIDFYNKWMTTTSSDKFEFNWDKFRYDKTIKPYKKTKLNTPAVVKISEYGEIEKWYEKVYKFIKGLKVSNKIQDYNQIAFLFKSVKNPKVTGLARYLEQKGINVYSPRSDMFFEREEIKTAIGCLIWMFPKYIQSFESGEYELGEDIRNYYISCINSAKKVFTNNKELKNWLREHGKIHAGLQRTTDYAFSGLLYQMFAFEPFRSILNTDMKAGVVDIRPLRNIALLINIIIKYEYLHNIDVFSGKKIDTYVEKLFNLYLRLLCSGGIEEYEDDSEYAPSGCVSFMTIHQSKGMEFPIVIVDSLSNSPRKNTNELMVEIEKKYYRRPPFEPHDQIKYFDFWRLYYTAFSRAQNLLILACNEADRSPSNYFKPLWNELVDITDSSFDINKFDFKLIKDVNLKDTFSFTSHISVYETCPIQYKFFKELGFTPIRAGAMLFGRLVHETIEDIHKTALRKEFDKITPENIEEWFNTNYSALVKAERTYLAEPQLKVALNQVLKYVDRNKEQLKNVQEAEVSVSYVKPDYIIEGKIDLIKGENDTVELIDFKTEKKPDLFANKDKIERYRRQLHIYAYLIEQNMNKKVSKMHIYYTAEQEGSSPFLSFNYSKTAIEGTIAAFDDTVHRIMNKDFSQCSSSSKTCKECDFRFYCSKS